jgi:hypothetical protein
LLKYHKNEEATENILNIVRHYLRTIEE